MTTTKHTARSRRDEHDEFTALIARVYVALSAVSLNGPRVIDRKWIPTGPDGYPTRASGAEPAGARGSSMPLPTVELDEHGWSRWRCGVRACAFAGLAMNDGEAQGQAAAHWREVHEPILDYADSTGAAAVADRPTRRDPLARAHDTMLDALARAEAAMLAALDAVTKVTAPDTEPLPGECASCARFHVVTPIAMQANGQPRYRLYCRRCGEFNGDHGQLPTKRLVQLIRENKPWTEAERADALRELGIRPTDQPKPPGVER